MEGCILARGSQQVEGTPVRGERGNLRGRDSRSFIGVQGRQQVLVHLACCLHVTLTFLQVGCSKVQQQAPRQDLHSNSNKLSDAQQELQQLKVADMLLLTCFSCGVGVRC